MIKKSMLMISYLGLFTSTIIFTGHIVFILGPCSSGKTTASFQLARELGAHWKLVEYDYWERRIGRSSAPATTIFEAMIEEVKDQVHAGYDVIVDANRYFPDLCACLSNAGHTCITIYLYAPYKTLLKRCKKRLKKHNHGQKWSHAIRAFVKMTFEHFYPRGFPEQTDGLVLDTTKLSRSELVTRIKAVIAEQNL
jgi:cytidylate kinase